MLERIILSAADGDVRKRGHRGGAGGDVMKGTRGGGGLCNSRRGRTCRRCRRRMDDESMTERDRTDPWEARFKELREYRITHGDFARSTRRAGALGTWVTNHHAAYRSVRREGRKSFLRLPQKSAPTEVRLPQKIAPTEVRLPQNIALTERLEGIDFFCGGRRNASPTWQERFAALKKWQEGERIVSHRKEFHRPIVGIAKWVSVKRKECKRFRKARGSLVTSGRRSSS